MWVLGGDDLRSRFKRLATGLSYAASILLTNLRSHPLLYLNIGVSESQGDLILWSL